MASTCLPNYSNYEKEIKLKNAIDSVEGRVLEKITEQMIKASCIIEKNKGQGTGFFCLIPFPNKIHPLPVLMTNNHILSKEDIIKGRIINISMKHNKFNILIDGSRKVYTDEIYDITIIEMKAVDGLNFNAFLEIDDLIYEEKPYEYFKDRSIYLIHYPQGNVGAEFAVGKIKRIDLDCTVIEHTCNSNHGSSGSPILDLKTNKVIGIHKGSLIQKLCNLGTFIKNPIEKIYQLYKNELEENEIRNYNDKNNIKNEDNNFSIFNDDISEGENNYEEKKNSNEIENKKDNKITENNKNNLKNNNEDNNNNFYNIDNNKMSKEKKENDNVDEIIIKYKRSNNTILDLMNKDKLNSIKESISYDKLFGENFVKNNKHLCKIIIGNREYELKSYLQNENDEVKKNEFEIKLKGINRITNLSCMFAGCLSLDSIKNFEKLNTINIEDFCFLFSFCKISFIPDISKWDTRNVIYINHMFFHCRNLKSIPDISKWKTSKIRYISYLFTDCACLETLPDISKWDTNNLEGIDGLFTGCKSLRYLPDISRWKTSKIKSMRNLFLQCHLLVHLPDISKWDTSNVTDMSGMFGHCISLETLPDISKWNTSKVKNMNKMFNCCKSLAVLPDISKWITFNVQDMSHMFADCKNLIELPDISKWNITNVKEKVYMFDGCNPYLYVPEKFKMNAVEKFFGFFKSPINY